MTLAQMDLSFNAQRHADVCLCMCVCVHVCQCGWLRGVRAHFLVTGHNCIKAGALI